MRSLERLVGVLLVTLAGVWVGVGSPMLAATFTDNANIAVPDDSCTIDGPGGTGAGGVIRQIIVTDSGTITDLNTSHSRRPLRLHRCDARERVVDTSDCTRCTAGEIEAYLDLLDG